MCFGRCASCIGYKLLILALLSIVANILLYFPNGETRFASEHHLGKYVECLHGILGGGLLVLIPAAVLIGLHNDDCCGCFGHADCGKSCAMLSSVLAAFIGILGSGYCIIISALGLAHGPYCSTHLERSWIYPFAESSGGYLFEYNKWSECKEPQNIVQWNVTLFSILLVLGGIEFILCFIQIINGILGGLCGLCCSHEEILLLAVILITLECSVFYRCCQSESCNKTYRSFISIVLALLGVAFSGYSCIIFTLGLIQGPFCNSSGGWDYIFKDTAGGYLTDYPAWSRCTEPANIVEWNTILLSILIALSGLQLIICFLKVAAELKRTLCGTYSVFVQAGIL
ncbi:transmembrane 4 L6 family member 1 isoform X2 [Phalacrocorax carbo]|uniref:transmembrane 4 L6 family member 1 isoform X2 n=1 Tax=Phalacrocorax carbo TaxID=9209 RepID=UPI00311A0E84